MAWCYTGDVGWGVVVMVITGDGFMGVELVLVVMMILTVCHAEANDDDLTKPATRS